MSCAARLRRLQHQDNRYCGDKKEGADQRAGAAEPHATSMPSDGLERHGPHGSSSTAAGPTPDPCGAGLEVASPMGPASSTRYRPLVTKPGRNILLGVGVLLAAALVAGIA